MLYWEKAVEQSAIVICTHRHTVHWNLNTWTVRRIHQISATILNEIIGQEKLSKVIDSHCNFLHVVVSTVLDDSLTRCQGICRQSDHQIWIQHIYRPSTSRVNSLKLGDTYMQPYMQPSLVQIMACCLFGTKPLSEPMLAFCELDPWEQTSVKFSMKFKNFHSRKTFLKMLSTKWQPFRLGLNVLIWIFA